MRKDKTTTRVKVVQKVGYNINTRARSLVKNTEGGGGQKETTFFSQVFVNQIERQKRKSLSSSKSDTLSRSRYDNTTGTIHNSLFNKLSNFSRRRVREELLTCARFSLRYSLFRAPRKEEEMD